MPSEAPPPPSRKSKTAPGSVDAAFKNDVNRRLAKLETMVQKVVEQTTALRAMQSAAVGQKGGGAEYGAPPQMQGQGAEAGFSPSGTGSGSEQVERVEMD